MKVLVVFHGLPPLAGRAVVGSGLRAFANGQALRAAGHDVRYCTRTEDLSAAPSEVPARLLLTAPVPSQPGRRTPRTAKLDAVLAPGGLAPEVDALDLTQRHPAVGWTQTEGLAPVGGPPGAPGNPYGYTDPLDLAAVLAEVDPDVVLMEALEDTRQIPKGRWSVVLDLFAPRILEQQFQSGPSDPREAVRVLDALQRADHYLFSNPRQKYFHLPLLALAGVDITAQAGGVVPISCPPDLPPVLKPPELRWVAGGVFWPWADLGPGLRDLLSVLDEVDGGRLQLYGGEYGIRSDTSAYRDPLRALPEDHPRLDFAGMVPIDALWDQYRQASLAFDLMVPNPERELNLSFRQVDYLRCGLPIVTSPQQVIASDLLEYGAGWLIEPGDRGALRDLVASLLADPGKLVLASRNAQRLAQERYSWAVTTGPLLDAVERGGKRAHGETLFSQMARTQADLWEEHQGSRKLRERSERQQDELGEKQAEIRAQDDKIRQLLGTVDRLTLALEEVSRFRSEGLLYLQEQQDDSLREAGDLRRALDRKQVDIQKKDAELDKRAGKLKELGAAVRELEEQNLALQGRVALGDSEALDLRERVRGLSERLLAAEGEIDAGRREVQTRSEALVALKEEQRRAEGRALEALHQAERRAEALLRSLAEELEAGKVALARAREEARIATDADAAEIARLRGRVAELERDLGKKQGELEQSRARAKEELARQADLVFRELDTAREASEATLRVLSGRVAELERDRARLSTALSQARQNLEDARSALAEERERWESETTKKQAEDEARARARAEEAARELRSKRAEVAALRAEVAELDVTRGALAEAQSRGDSLEADLAKKDAEVAELRRARAEEGKRAARRADAQALEAAEVAARLESVQGELEERRFALAAAEADRVKKEEELRRVQAERVVADRAASQARAELEARALEAEARAVKLGVEAEELAFREAALRADLEKKEAELQRTQEERAAAERAAQAALGALDGRIVGIQAELASRTAENEELAFREAALRADLEKKTRELGEALASRDAVKAELIAALVALESADAD